MNASWTPVWRTLVTMLGLALLSGVWSGCGNYQMGTRKMPSFRTIYVEPVTSEATIPQGEALVSRATRLALNRDPRVSLVNSAAEADVTLKIVLTNFGREVSAVQAGDTGLARKYDLVLSADCTVTDNRSGEIVMRNRPVSTKRQSYTDSGQIQAEYGTLPVLAESLGKGITREILDVW